MKKKRKELKSVDIEELTRRLAEADSIILIMGESFIESIKDPEDIQHEALNIQIQEAAKGEKDVFLICFRPIEKDNFSLVMDMLEGSKLKCIIFVDPKNDEDRERSTRILRYLMGPRVKVTGSSLDTWRFE